MGSSLHLVVRSLRIIPVFVRHESFMLHESQRGHNAIPAIFIGAIFIGAIFIATRVSSKHPNYFSLPY
jgi:hypothetical protein